jgi:preprotein translocase SecE subunit
LARAPDSKSGCCRFESCLTRHLIAFGNFMGEWTQKFQEGTRRSVEFFNEAWQELKKVHWPSRKETYAATLVVIIVVIVISIYLALVDFGLTRAIQAIID